MNETNHPARRLRHGDRPTEPLVFEDDAANKAAEEGGLPALPEPWIQNWDAPKGSQDHFAADQMHDYARAAIAADRASRQVANKDDIPNVFLDSEEKVSDWCDKQVANKAEVEPTCVCGSPATLGSVHRTDGPCYVADATPPATTGAMPKDLAIQCLNALDVDSEAHAALSKFIIECGVSTVLTDERENCPNCYADREDSIGCADCDGTGTIAREVAAQAGQVAVPGWVSVDERLPSVPVNSDRQFIIACQRTNGKTYVFAASYLNALELDSNDDGESIFTGWHTEGEHAEYSSWYEPVCQAGEKVTHWQELPTAPSPAKESK